VTPRKHSNGRRAVVATIRNKPARTLDHTVCPKCQGTGLINGFNGLLLRYWREKRGVTLRAMALLVGCSNPYLSDIETNRRTVPEKIVAIYQQHLGVR